MATAEQIARELLNGPIKSLEGQTLITQPRAKQFYVQEVFDNHVWIRTGTRTPRHIYLDDWKDAIEGYVRGHWSLTARKQYYDGYNYSYINAIFRSPAVRAALDKHNL